MLFGNLLEDEMRTMLRMALWAAERIEPGYTARIREMEATGELGDMALDDCHGLPPEPELFGALDEYEL